MSNNPVSVLMDEHDVIKKIENSLAKLDGLWEKDAPKYKATLEKILHFLKQYSDAYHHHKEEDVLFPALEEHPEFILSSIITEMNEHHENFRDYTRAIAEALQENNYRKAQDTFKKYLNELLDHIAIENDELFVLAESLFDEEELKTMFFKFKDIDMELGESKKAELEKFPDEIENSL
jgi:hemerythrin-like domain-containing protein